MNRDCAVQDEQLLAFATGDEFDLDEHVAGCEECQDFLEELWTGGLETDLTEPVVKTIRLELFLIEVAKLFGDIAVDMGRAARVYLFDADDSVA